MNLADAGMAIIEALEFYGNTENYMCLDPFKGSPIENDNGERARAAMSTGLGVSRADVHAYIQTIRVGSGPSRGD